eukprot:scaffold27288_cov107-Skeletonema_marinoi.AAC.1
MMYRRRYGQEELEPRKRCFYTIMANYNGPLEAVDCDMHVVRYDMVLERSDCAAKDGLIRSPTTFWRRRYGLDELEPRKKDAF